MESRKLVTTQALAVLFGEVIVSAIMVGVFALLGYYDRTVLLGGIAGAVIAACNHLILMLSVVAASNKAEKQDVKGGQALIQMSYMGRLLGLFVVLVVCAKSGLCNPLALVIPLVFVRPILTIADYFQNKKGGANS